MLPQRPGPALFRKLKVLQGRTDHPHTANSPKIMTLDPPPPPNEQPLSPRRVNWGTGAAKLLCGRVRVVSGHRFDHHQNGPPVTTTSTYTPITWQRWKAPLDTLGLASRPTTCW